VSIHGRIVRPGIAAKRCGCPKGHNTTPTRHEAPISDDQLDGADLLQNTTPTLNCFDLIDAATGCDVPG